MKIKCNYCGAMVDETAECCPQCAAPLSGANRVSDEQPKTIEQLQAWYVAHHLPPENITRFFIGKDIKEPKAFGIYQSETGDFVVYKNKSTGERAIRYQGADEAYAVNELYQRLRSVIVDQKGRNPGKGQTATPTTTKTTAKKVSKGCGIGCASIFFLFFLLIALLAFFDKTPPNGYYNYDGKEYYHQNSSWYYYDAETDEWSPTEFDAIDSDNADEFRLYSHDGKSFEETSWYDDGSTSDDYDWDDDDDWGSSYDDDDWDSGGTDWDSDW